DHPLLTRETVEALDAVLGVPTVAAHVELTVRARPARHRVRSADHRDHELACSKSAAPFPDPPQRLVPEHQALLTGRCRAVVARRDLPVGAAHAHGNALDHELTGAGSRLRLVCHGQAARLTGHARERPQRISSGSAVEVFAGISLPRCSAALTSPTWLNA